MTAPDTTYYDLDLRTSTYALLVKMAVKFEFPFAQTPHVIAFVCTVAVALLFSPVGKLEMERGGLLSYCNKLVHFATFGSWLGVQLWVTFFAGSFVESQFPCIISVVELSV